MKEEIKAPDFIFVIKFNVTKEAADRIEKSLNEKFTNPLIIFSKDVDVDIYQKEEIYKKVF